MLWLVVDTDEFDKFDYATYSLDSTNNWCLYDSYEEAKIDAETTLLNEASERMTIIPLDTENSVTVTVVKSIRFD